MAKKKELPKAMSGGIKPLIRAVVSTGKVAGKATVRGSKAMQKAVEHSAVKGPVSFVKAGGKGIKAAGKGFVRGVKSETEKLKAQKISVAEPDSGPTKKSMSDWAKSGTKPATTEKKVADSKPKKKLTTKQKVGIGVATGAAVAGGIKYANRKRRTLND